MLFKRRQLLQLAGVGIGTPLPFPCTSLADAYPSRPTDGSFRSPRAAPPIRRRAFSGQWLSQRLGQQVIVENKPGGGTNCVGVQAAIAAPVRRLLAVIVVTMSSIRRSTRNCHTTFSITSRRSRVWRSCR